MNGGNAHDIPLRFQRQGNFRDMMDSSAIHATDRHDGGTAGRIHSLRPFLFLALQRQTIQCGCVSTKVLPARRAASMASS